LQGRRPTSELRPSRNPMTSFCFVWALLGDFQLLIGETLHLSDLRSNRQAALRSLFQRIRSRSVLRFSVRIGPQIAFRAPQPSGRDRSGIITRYSASPNRVADRNDRRARPMTLRDSSLLGFATTARGAEIPLSSCKGICRSRRKRNAPYCRCSIAALAIR
jgi:hypothetical protein